MSKERQRRRAAQGAARGKPAAKASRSGAVSDGRPGAGAAAASGSAATSRKVRGSAGRPRGGSAARPGGTGRGKKPTVYRQRRFKPLPMRLKAALAVGWLVVAVLVLVFVPTWTARIGFLVIATMLLPLIVVLVRDPTRRTR